MISIHSFRVKFARVNIITLNATCLPVYDASRELFERDELDAARRTVVSLNRSICEPLGSLLTDIEDAQFV
jgi:hypothetical protein